MLHCCAQKQFLRLYFFYNLFEQCDGESQKFGLVRLHCHFDLPSRPVLRWTSVLCKALALGRLHLQQVCLSSLSILPVFSIRTFLIFKPIGPVPSLPASALPLQNRLLSLESPTATAAATAPFCHRCCRITHCLRCH